MVELDLKRMRAMLWKLVDFLMNFVIVFAAILIVVVVVLAVMHFVFGVA